MGPGPLQVRGFFVKPIPVLTIKRKRVGLQAP